MSSMDVTKPQLFGVMDHVAPIEKRSATAQMTDFIWQACAETR